MRIKKFILLLGLVAGLFFVSNVATAQSTQGERVRNFASNVRISKDNSATITETIIYDFGALNRHGIYRTIPVDYKDGNKTYKVAFDHVSTKTGDGRNITTEVSKKDGNKVLKIGDADKTITGQHTYVITYKLWPIITKVDGKPRLLLDINGNGWQVPMDRVSATISFDEGVSLSDVNCYTGAFGSTTQDCIVQESFPPTYTASDLSAGENLTITGTVPDGYVDAYLVANARRPLTKDDVIQYILFGLIGLIVAVITAFFAYRSWRTKKRRKNQTVVAQYEAPDGMTPAEVGFLQDDVADMREITATFIDLAIRGYIKITQTNEKSLFKKAGYSLQKLCDFSDTQDYEQTLLKELFSKGDSVNLSDLDKAGMAVAVATARTQLQARLTTRGFYNETKNEPGLLQKILDGGKISDVGATQWAKVAGFKLYLGVAEKDRLNFTDAPAKTPERFSTLLPFAVALGVEKEWAKQFEGIDISPATNSWYYGATPYFAASAFASDISTNFATAVSSNAVVASSGSSGGGSSGGGFSGGGGGSW